MRGARYVRLIPWTLHSGSEHVLSELHTFTTTLAVCTECPDWPPHIYYYSHCVYSINCLNFTHVLLSCLFQLPSELHIHIYMYYYSCYLYWIYCLNSTNVLLTTTPPVCIECSVSTPQMYYYYSYCLYWMFCQNSTYVLLPLLFVSYVLSEFHTCTMVLLLLLKIGEVGSQPFCSIRPNKSPISPGCVQKGIEERLWGAVWLLPKLGKSLLYRVMESIWYCSVHTVQLLILLPFTIQSLMYQTDSARVIST
jgi:hypothetical protein